MAERLANKLLIIGWDAADWMIIDHLFAASQMPHLRQLVDGGVRADLATLEPKLSPLLWTSIATGKTADRHGILHFVEPDPAGDGLRVVSSTSRKTKALWNMLTQSGLRVNVVGWYASHPAEPINGVCVSNLFQEGQPAMSREKWPLAAGSVHPPEMADRIAAERVHPAKIGTDELKLFVPRLETVKRSDALMTNLTRHLAQCHSIHNAATAILKDRSDWDCTMVFFDTIDVIGHHFMQFHPPRMPYVSPTEFEAYREVMSAVYRLQDRLLGELLQLAGPETTVILISDHGFYSDHRRPIAQEVPPEQRAAIEAAWHRPMGVLAMSGPGIVRGGGRQVYGASVLDITPTALALLGLPLGADMNGRPLVEAFEHPVKPESLFGWDQHAGEAGMHPPEMRLDPFESRDALDQLVELGYMAELSGDAKAKIDLARKETRFNLAAVYMTTGRPHLAADVYGELARERPDEPRYVLGQARCLYMCMQFEDSASVLRGFLARNPSSAEAHMLLAGTLALAGRQAEATQELLAIEQIHADRMDLAPGLGDVCSTLGRWNDADRHYRRAAAHDPTNTHVLIGLARAAIGRMQLEESVDYCLRAVELQHTLPEAHHVLGVALTWMGEYQHAIKSFNVAVSMQPGNLDSHRFLASIYRHLHDRENAARHRVIAEKLISDKAQGGIDLEFLKRVAPMGPLDWAKQMDGPTEAGAASPAQENPR